MTTAKAKKTSSPNYYYFIGINGVAMASVAVMAKQMGLRVMGSDEDKYFPTDAYLQHHGIKRHQGFQSEHLDDKPDVVVLGTSFGHNNPEVKTAKSRRIPILSMSEMLGQLMAGQQGIVVTGVHGKTTTTSLIASILQNAGFSPSYMIGTFDVPGLGEPGKIGSGKYFVVEGDEYKRAEEDTRPKFLDYPVEHLIITSIELDHPDLYQTQEHVYEAFYKLSMKVPRSGSIIACSDWPLVRRLVSRRADRNCLTYGFESGANYQIIQAKYGDKTEFKIRHQLETYGPYTLKLPGQHNVLNATSAIVLSKQLGISDESIRKSLAEFSGPKRRFEILGTINDAIIIDDYAHHPTALEFLLQAARQRYPQKRLVVVFQPHTYSRTGKLLKEFAESLKNSDLLILTNIFASAREKPGYVTIGDLITEIKKRRGNVEFRPSLEETAQFLKSTINKNDVVLLVGAGDIYKIYDILKNNAV